MNCDEVGRFLSEAAVSTPLPEQVKQHLKECSHCLNAARALDPSARQDSPTPAQLERIKQALLSDLSPVRPLPHPIYNFIALAVIFVGAVAGGVWWLGIAGLSAMSRLQATAVLTALAAVALMLAYSMVQQMTPGSAQKFEPRSLPIAILVALAVLIALLFQLQAEHNFLSQAWGCILPGSLIAALTAVPLWLVMRRGAILSPPSVGLAAGLLAGLAAATALEIRCPILDAGHILASHIGTAALSAAAGLLLGLFADRPLRV